MRAQYVCEQGTVGRVFSAKLSALIASYGFIHFTNDSASYIRISILISRAGFEISHLRTSNQACILEQIMMHSFLPLPNRFFFSRKSFRKGPITTRFKYPSIPRSQQPWGKGRASSALHTGWHLKQLQWNARVATTTSAISGRLASLPLSWLSCNLLCLTCTP